MVKFYCFFLYNVNYMLENVFMYEDKNNRGLIINLYTTTKNSNQLH